MQRLIAAKKEGTILTCYRYASAAINNTNDLIIVIQELIAKSVENAGLEYKARTHLRKVY
jgi:dihydroxyacetone kinase-like predicted kinase